MNKDLLKNLTPEMLDSLTVEQRVELNKLIKELKEREAKYPILDYKLQPYQQEFEDAIKAKNEDGTPKYKFIIFIGGNGTGKTQTCAYLTQLKAIGEDTKKFGLPYIGSAPIIKVVTSTGSQIIENITPYMLGTGTSDDDIKFPGYMDEKNTGDVVKKVRKDKEVLKSIEMKNGNQLFFGSYDQGQARLQGGSPDFTWIDEVPTRWADFRELIRGTRKTNAQFLMSFTPTNYNKKIYDWVFGGQDNKFVRKVDALENKFADHSWMEGLSEDELRIVRYGDFTPPTGLVYKNFRRDTNMVEHFHPRKLGNDVKYYGSVDFGVKHPTAFLFIAVDSDGHIYVFDMFYESGASMATLAQWIRDKEREYGIELQYIVADSAGARERLELKEEGIHTKKARKQQKEGAMSNRRGGIMRINQQLNLGNLIISDKCQPLIEEFETHHYKEKGEDGSVEKYDDDALDALRYFIFSYMVPSEKKELKKKRRKIARKAQKKRKY